MSKFFFVIAATYVAVTVAAGIAALLTTLWAYNLDDRMVSDTATAAIVNTAAAVAAMGFFGGFDMIFTVWQFLRNQEAERIRNQEREEERKEREEGRKAREEERRAREEERRVREEERLAREEERRAWQEEIQANRVEREEFIALLRTERERSEALTARVMELTDLVISRNNGRDTNGNAENDRGE